MLCLSHLWIEKWLGCWMVWYIRQQQYHTTYSEWYFPYKTLDNSFIWCMSKFSSFIGILWKTVNFYFQIISFMQRNNESLQLLKKKKDFMRCYWHCTPSSCCKLFRLTCLSRVLLFSCDSIKESWGRFEEQTMIVFSLIVFVWLAQCLWVDPKRCSL